MLKVIRNIYFTQFFFTLYDIDYLIPVINESMGITENIPGGFDVCVSKNRQRIIYGHAAKLIKENANRPNKSFTGRYKLHTCCKKVVSFSKRYKRIK